MRLYPKNTSAFDPTLFQNPTAEYRGTPFWSWNTKLDHDPLMRQIDVLAEMGMGGFHIHARTGLATEYLGDEFMTLVAACVEKARAKKMLVWLYDEDRWPSGSAGGKVTRDPQYRARHLVFTPTPYDGSLGVSPQISGAQAGRTGNGDLIARYVVCLENGYLADYRRLAEHDATPKDGQVWYAYLETALESPWFNNQTYVDTLNKSAIERFIDVTHERYKSVVGAEFGKIIPAMFTDEPQFPHKQSLSYAESLQDVVLPFTTDFLTTFHDTYGQRLEDHLPELFWELPNRQPSLARYRYHDHVAERFCASFADTVGAWCRANGIALTGHMMEEPTLQSQTAAVGEVMRAYRGFDLPGIDMLCDWHEYTTAKQAQSAANQLGAPGVLSELYGVTNWDFDFTGHKAQGDWQAALGITVRVLHLALVSLAGEGKRDYPASINYQVPWYGQYALVEDYFARLNTALTRGKRRVRIGVIHPIESFWLCFGALEQTQAERQERDRAFKQITDWLLFGLLDFDFISESLMLALPGDGEGASFQVGQAAYEVVIVPGMRTIRATTLDKLERFSAAGGQVIFVGEIPSLVDAQPSTRAIAFAQECVCLPYTQSALVNALADRRDLDIRLADGAPADALLYQMRDDGQERMLFICNTDRQTARPDVEIRLNGAWSVTQLDALTGAIEPVEVAQKAAMTVFTWTFEAHGSLLLRLSPATEPITSLVDTLRLVNIARPTYTEIGLLRDPVPVTLSEPNVLLLDMAEYRLDDEAWQPTEEILRLDNGLRTRLGYPLRMEALAQPWTYGALPPPTHRLSLRFQFETTVTLTDAQLAVEDAAHVSLMLDDHPIPNAVTGWFVDEAIGTIRLPVIEPGVHHLVVTLPFGAHTHPEACYLLGDFGVTLHGRHCQLVSPVRELAFGDWTRQGLPFYAGNVTYQCAFNLESAVPELRLEVAHFKAALLTVALDQGVPQPIAFAPFQATFNRVGAGEHQLALTAYGSRVNTFGPVHNVKGDLLWVGPNAWRSTGRDWAYEYQVKPCGVLVAPTLYRVNRQ